VHPGKTVFAAGAIRAWKLGSLEAWKLGSLEAFYNFHAALPSLFPSFYAFYRFIPVLPCGGLMVNGMGSFAGGLRAYQDNSL
jgi:hypothetical protein